jgi:hypothetical protein
MDVNILTKKEKILSRCLITAIPLIIVFFVISCRGKPEEGEIVIRAEDIAAGDSFAENDTLSVYPPSTDTIVTDTIDITVPAFDSLIVLPDSLATDSSSVSGPGIAECPWERVVFEINGSIYASLSNRVENSDILGAHIVRCMWWNTDPWRGMNAGDSLYVLVGETGRENQVIALSYIPREGTTNRPFSVYSFRMTGDNYPSHYYSDGTEVMKQLDYMPITTFEEMTGPYGEPRGNHSHSGVDFKAPAGTPVRTCRGGTVTRVNWNHDYNGDCVEVGIGSGYSEIFLHLQGVAEGIHEGTILQKGDIIGTVGNTGVTSTASHLHYQINDENGNPIDPYLFFSSRRRSLLREDMTEFSYFRDNCDRWFRSVPE